VNFTTEHNRKVYRMLNYSLEFEFFLISKFSPNHRKTLPEIYTQSYDPSNYKTEYYQIIDDTINQVSNCTIKTIKDKLLTTPLFRLIDMVNDENLALSKEFINFKLYLLDDVKKIDTGSIVDSLFRDIDFFLGEITEMYTNEDQYDLNLINWPLLFPIMDKFKLAIGGNHGSTNDAPLDFWKIEFDCGQIEIKTPIANIGTTFHYISEILEGIQDVGVTQNNSGVHVNISDDSYPLSTRSINQEMVHSKEFLDLIRDDLLDNFKDRLTEKLDLTVSEHKPMGISLNSLRDVPYETNRVEFRHLGGKNYQYKGELIKKIIRKYSTMFNAMKTL
jgi:hypothetical protein